jgi:hypothetical protein
VEILLRRIRSFRGAADQRAHRKTLTPIVTRARPIPVREPHGVETSSGNESRHRVPRKT